MLESIESIEIITKAHSGAQMQKYQDFGEDNVYVQLTIFCGMIINNKREKILEIFEKFPVSLSLKSWNLKTNNCEKYAKAFSLGTLYSSEISQGKNQSLHKICQILRYFGSFSMYSIEANWFFRVY